MKGVVSGGSQGDTRVGEWENEWARRHYICTLVKGICLKCR